MSFSPRYPLAASQTPLALLTLHRRHERLRPCSTPAGPWRRLNVSPMALTVSLRISRSNQAPLLDTVAQRAHYASTSVKVLSSPTSSVHVVCVAARTTDGLERHRHGRALGR